MKKSRVRRKTKTEKRVKQLKEDRHYYFVKMVNKYARRVTKKAFPDVDDPRFFVRIWVRLKMKCSGLRVLIRNKDYAKGGMIFELVRRGKVLKQIKVVY